MLEHTVTTIDLLRHGKPVGGEIFRGKTDVALSDEGWQQMQAAIATPQAWQQIISSPMQRCMAFAEQTAKQRQLKVASDNAFQEISFGDWDGQAISAIQQTQADLLKNYWRNPFDFTPPNAEPMQDFYQRVVLGFEKTISQFQGQHCLLVTHGGVIRIILSHILQAEQLSFFRYDVPYASLSRIKIYHDNEGNWPQLVFFNQ